MTSIKTTGRRLRTIGETSPIRVNIDPAPPLDYELDAELDIPGLAISPKFAEDLDDKWEPANFPPVFWLIVGTALLLLGIALFMVLPWKG